MYTKGASGNYLNWCVGLIRIVINYLTEKNTAGDTNINMAIKQLQTAIEYLETNK